MSLRIGSTAPDFEADTTQGRIHFHDWLGDSWAVLFSHPKDYTPVCTTELGEVARLKPEFDRRNTKVIGLSVDKVSDHSGWANDIRDVSGHEVTFPMIGDYDLNVSKLYNMLPEEEPEAVKQWSLTSLREKLVRTGAKVVRHGRYVILQMPEVAVPRELFQEILRLLDSIQLTAQHPIATPVNWNPGDDVIVAPSLSNAQAQEKFGSFNAVKPYLRTIPQPGSAGGATNVRPESEKQPA